MGKWERLCESVQGWKRERETQNDILKKTFFLHSEIQPPPLVQPTCLELKKTKRIPQRYCLLPAPIKENKTYLRTFLLPKATVRVWVEGLKCANSNMMFTFSSQNFDSSLRVSVDMCKTAPTELSTQTRGSRRLTLHPLPLAFSFSVSLFLCSSNMLYVFSVEFQFDIFLCYFCRIGFQKQKLCECAECAQLCFSKLSHNSQTISVWLLLWHIC